MTDNIKRGNEGETLAASFLEAKGFQIVEKNYRYKRSEIDLIVTKENWLIFIEVKMRSSMAFGFPEEFVDEKKIEKILEGAEHYIFDKNWNGNVRYDIISVSMKDGKPTVTHFEDAFH